MNIHEFWKAVLAQDEDEIRKYFHENAYINWHCTNEHFNLDEYVIANCEYPGEWDGAVERINETDDLIITVVNVYPKDKSVSFHVTSFIKIVNDKIVSLDEYWADDSGAPQWRLDKHIGTAIRGNCQFAEADIIVMAAHYWDLAGGSIIWILGFEYVEKPAHALYGIRDVRQIQAEGVDMIGVDTAAIMEKEKRYSRVRKGEMTDDI